jgi:hypothetical protein
VLEISLVPAAGFEPATFGVQIRTVKYRLTRSARSAHPPIVLFVNYFPSLLQQQTSWIADGWIGWWVWTPMHPV